jgi:GNAT superfamily N-acetyltransferase
MEIVVRRPQAKDQAEWSQMRAALWPETSADSHAEEIAALLGGNLTGWLAGPHAVAVFVAVRPDGGLCGFLEASVRPMADGCTTHPVGYVEGWYVDPGMRRKGVGRALLEASEEWVSSWGCQEMASDARLTNSASIAAHKALGFDDEAPTVRLRKWLPAAGGGRREGPQLARRLTLVPLEGTCAVCRFDADAPLPGWVSTAPFLSVTRTAEELSVVCREDCIPDGVRCEKSWRGLRVDGRLDFSLVGILHSLLTPLAAAGISVFAISTFDTDYLLVRAGDFDRTVEALGQAGHTVRACCQ